MTAAAADEVRATETWFVTHGLPYFVDDLRAKVRQGLTRSRLVRLVALALLVGAAVGVGVGWWSGEVDAGLVWGVTAASAVLVLYALTTLRARVIASWAIRRTLGSLGQLFPLVTRALPLLLLFVTFLFINAEVWEVASRLDGSVMWLTVALFTASTAAPARTRPLAVNAVASGVRRRTAVRSWRRTPASSTFARSPRASRAGCTVAEVRRIAPPRKPASQ